MQRCQNPQNMMESNEYGGIFVEWGMSRASKRAQERPNRSSYELVMDKTKISRIQKLGVPDVRKRPEIR